MTKREKELLRKHNPLTENDKAAHYAGWSAYHYDHVHWFWRDEHSNRAPDMSDPRNYMKALQGLASRGLYVDSCLYLASAGPFARMTIWPKEGRVSDSHPPLAEARGKINEVPTLILAALYDADAKAHGLEGD